jgi:hypothetical protein
MLYSLLEVFDYPSLCLSRYPQICRSGGAEGRAVQDEIVAHVLDKRQPVSVEELKADFVDTRGFSLPLVANIVYNERLLRYYPGCVVHRDAIGWSDAKAESLAVTCAGFYAERVAAGEYVARASTLLEARESQLPLLNDGFSWTEVLLQSCLERLAAR